DARFHRTLAEAADKRYAWTVIEEDKAQMDRLRHLSFHPMHIDHLIEQHAAIVEAIAARDVAGAERVMRTLLREIIRSVVELVAERPELFAQNANRKHHRRKEDATT